MDKKYIKSFKVLVYMKNSGKKAKRNFKYNILKNGSRKEKNSNIKGKSGNFKLKKEGFYLTLANNDSSRWFFSLHIRKSYRR